MHRVGSYLLLFVFLCLGTGAVDYVHNQQHAAEDAREDAIAAATGHQTGDHHHDESNCAVHAQLHLQYMAIGPVVFFISMGLFVAFLTPLATPLVPREVPNRADCRDPPACLQFA